MGQSAMEDVATKAPPSHYRVSRATAESTLIWTRASSNSPPGSLKKAPFRLLDDWSESRELKRAGGSLGNGVLRFALVSSTYGQSRACPLDSLGDGSWGPPGAPIGSPRGL